jgi:hypothetical protein
MRLLRILVVLLAAGAVAGCGVSVSDLNARPTKYYQETVRFTGQIVRMQPLSGETLLEIEDAHGSRILVQTTEELDKTTGDWVRVKGILVPEARVGGRTLYDIVLAEDIGGASRPRLRNLF